MPRPVCPYPRVIDALREATDGAVIVVKGGRYAEHPQFPQEVRVTTNNITLQALGAVLLELSGPWLAIDAPHFTIKGALELRGGGVLICEGATLHQNGDLSISTTEFLATGVKVAAGGTWLQLGRTTISAGAADGDFSLTNGVHVEANAIWQQLGELSVYSHGAIGVLVSGTWDQLGEAKMIVQGEGDAKRGNYGLVFGEGVRLAHGAWSQKGALHINAIDASNAIHLSAGSVWLQDANVVLDLDSVQERRHYDQLGLSSLFLLGLIRQPAPVVHG
ncbi:uncharacterized protein ACA1_004980 [Acanthamoeba castellanii str. Neff]|uniref:DUF1565 domain-containing protein n=1 Tax=Acanthamoeba castellanii (strain ATCC 30010 / Neff) TaxID=1257118 RepID=L8GMU7_ACACF|nr:uncharacterized protein ACA1_004980 [Acanthamoeba castellanii str. Neff]ELR14129.1 hypothetical protein ACA1_004980 [Acanthamoeba castellanii str. Neff]